MTDRPARRPLVIVAAVGREPSNKAAVRQAVRAALEDLPVEPELRLPVGRAQLLEALPGAQVYFGFRLDEEILAAGQDLEWVHLGISGVDSHLPPEAGRKGLLYTNSRGLHGAYMSEYVMGVVLAHSKCLLHFRDEQKERRWDPSRWLPRIRTVEDTTMGLVGLGAVGRHLAPCAKAMGIEVLGVRRTPEPGPPPPGVDEVFPPSQADEVLRRSDWLVLLLPLTAETRGFMSRARIGKMKRGAFLINVGRGELVDEKALLTALEKGKLSGAALDVFREEPLSPKSGLWGHPEVLITPHIAGNFPGYIEAAADLFGENLSLYARGSSPENQVDTILGY